MSYSFAADIPREISFPSHERCLPIALPRLKWSLQRSVPKSTPCPAPKQVECAHPPQGVAVIEDDDDSSMEEHR